MDRRRVIGALGGAATLGAGGWFYRMRTNDLGDDRTRIETLDAPGSAAGTRTIPPPEPAVVTFFATWCRVCSRQMGSIAAVEAAVDTPVVSVTIELVGRSVSRTEVVEWWDEHDGDWTVGIDDDGALAERFEVSSIPKVVVLDEEGTIRWSETGEIDAEELRTATRLATEG